MWTTLNTVRMYDTMTLTKNRQLNNDSLGIHMAITNYALWLPFFFFFWFITCISWLVVVLYWVYIAGGKFLCSRRGYGFPVNIFEGIWNKPSAFLKTFVESHTYCLAMLVASLVDAQGFIRGILLCDMQILCFALLTCHVKEPTSAQLSHTLQSNNGPRRSCVPVCYSNNLFP